MAKVGISDAFKRNRGKDQHGGGGGHDEPPDSTHKQQWENGLKSIMARKGGQKGRKKNKRGKNSLPLTRCGGAILQGHRPVGKTLNQRGQAAKGKSIERIT